MNEAHEIVPAYLAVKAMRDNGYKNTAYAIAELIDNSIQAKANEVKLVCIEGKVGGRRQINSIAVIDNGVGMDGSVLRMSLQFGNGTNLVPEKQKGIGKFGMGLPNSSISQCKKVEVYTWKNGGKALYSYLDIDKIIGKVLKEVPKPEERDIPHEWKKHVTSTSGTMVLWSKIDRCQWQTAKSIFTHSENLIGRTYRYFIQNGKVVIKMIGEDESGHALEDPKNFETNDPIYLMKQTSCPDPFKSTAMFNRWEGDDYENTFSVNHNGEDHDVKVRFTYAREAARDVKMFGGDAGRKPHGKHAQKNLGVSIVRAKRELDLDTRWAIQYEPIERWWGIEVEFPPSLDDVFGVSNNKQSARKFTSDLMDIGEELYEGRTFHEYLDELKQNHDPEAILIDIANNIKSNLGSIRKALKLQTRGTRRTRHHQSTTVEVIATEATKELQEYGSVGKSDAGESMSNQDKRTEIEKSLSDANISNSDTLAATIVNDNYKYTINSGDIDGDAFLVSDLKVVNY